MTKKLPALTHCVNLTQVLAQLLRDLSAKRLITLRLRQPNATFLQGFNRLHINIGFIKGSPELGYRFI